VSDVFAKRVFFVSGISLFAGAVFVYGLCVERFQIWPYELVHSTVGVVKSVTEFGEIVPAPPGRRVVAPVGASRETFTIHDGGRISDGYYVIVGWDGDVNGYSARLYDKVGDRRHTWRLDYFALDPDGPLNGGDDPHAFQVLPDGSVVVGFDDGDVMARLDVCSELVWKKTGVFHHVMSRAEDGSLWVWRGDNTVYGAYHYLHHFDAETGATIREIALVEDIIAGLGERSVVFGVRPNDSFERFERDPANRIPPDIFHPNDVDVLSSTAAPLFPMFEAGDLLLSFRNLNLVAVIDGDDADLKWWSHGPWITQHDPDFAPDGTISVFSNNAGRGRSEIVKMAPSTRELSNELFHGEVAFGIAFMGVHQYLPNGNVLIVLPGEGRVLEVTRDGHYVMEFNNLLRGHPAYNEHVENGIWVPTDYFTEFPHCAS
jgi:hypothetical protein